MMSYKIDPSKKWDYENGFYLTSETKRLGKLLAQFEIYKKIINIPGIILECGVYKGASLARLLAFRSLLENDFSRKVIGFDTFEQFPRDVHLQEDLDFIKKFEKEGGIGINEKYLKKILNNKGYKNFELIKGDILETIPKFEQKNPHERIALLHIDVDVFEPTKVILEYLWAKIPIGGILMIDDYGTVLGATKAVDEFFLQKGQLILKTNFNNIPCYIVKS